jgi:glycerol-3-phosphate O-acyltransferase
VVTTAEAVVVTMAVVALAEAVAVTVDRAATVAAMDVVSLYFW